MENTLELQNNNYELFSGGGTYLNYCKLFIGYFNSVPNIKIVTRLDFDTTKIGIEDKFKTQIRCKHFEQVISKEEQRYNLF